MSAGLNLPNAPPSYSQDDQSGLRRAIAAADRQNVKRMVAVDYLLLSSPNGTVGKLTVSNAGVLSWAAL